MFVAGLVSGFAPGVRSGLAAGAESVMAFTFQGKAWHLLDA
jgi:hypothetical protein